MRTRLRIASVLAALVAGCETDVPDLNNPGIAELQNNPTPSAVNAVATGLLIGARSGIALPNGYVSLLGVLGRESLDLDAGDPRFVTELLLSPALDPGTPAIGGNFWVRPYANIRNANILLAALSKVPGMTDADKASTAGFAKTIQALDFLQVINTHDDPPEFHGVPVDVDLAGTAVAPLVPKAQVFARIAQLLDDGAASLQSGGAKFPFPLSAGFTGFDTPATFLKANRALKARVEVYRGNFAAALTALSQSFLDTASPLTLGVYHAYGTGPGDLGNGLTSPNMFAHPSIATDAEPGDLRVTAKIRNVGERSLQGATSNLAFGMYQKPDAPVSIIRNEELILLRAEANIGLLNIPAAAADINFVRVNSGGLAPRNDLTAGNALDELLKQKRFSLLFEGGHRWIDLRRYGKLGTLPTTGGQFIISTFPIPTPEADVRR